MQTIGRASLHSAQGKAAFVRHIAIFGLLGLACALVVLAPALCALRAHAPVVLEDDGYYYTQIARTLAHTGRSSFDGLSATNGYHPLWLLLLALKTRLLGDSTFAVVLIEAACLGGAAALLLGGVGVRTWGPALLFTAVFAHYVGAMAGVGMEVSLFALCAAAFVRALGDPSGGGVWLGLAAAVCIGARIDSAAFVAPAILLCDRPWRDRGVALAVLAGAGAVYAGTNLALFGAAMPVSSAIKSLGGLQLNHRFFAQLGVELRAFGRDGGGRMLMALAGCALAPLIGLAAPRGSTARTLGWSTGIGGALLFAKLAFDSSWQIWPWYAFPFVFVFATALYALSPYAHAAIGRRSRMGLALVGAAALALVGVRAARVVFAAPATSGFYAVNQMAAARFAVLTHGAPLAMGDRAGSFAWSYPGPVVQLEGLVNDAAWLRMIRRREDPAPELCRRGVRYVAAYTAAVLGRYDHLAVPLMRPKLTQFPARMLDVRGADELAAVSSPATFDAARYGDGDPVLRLWRLRCGDSDGRTVAVAAAPPATGP